MADITKCTGDYCELKESCYRYKAKDNEYRQAYYIKAPIKNNKCNEYWQYCDKCHQFNGVHKLSCSTQKKIEIRL